MKTVQFKRWNCAIKKEMYKNGVTALVLYDVNDGEEVFTATVSLPEYQLQEAKDDITFIKNWSENEGILECLVENEIVENLQIQVPTGFVMAHMVKVLI